MSESGESGRMRRLVRRWASSDAQVEAETLRAGARESGAVAIDAAPRGQLATVRGTVRSVTLRPRAGVPSLEAELYDGSGRMTLIWLGRRRIGGVEPGRTMVVTGRMTCQSDELLMYNPRYELKPMAGE